MLSSYCKRTTSSPNLKETDTNTFHWHVFALAVAFDWQRRQLKGAVDVSVLFVVRVVRIL